MQATVTVVGMKANCLYCHQEFEAKRSTAKYCCSKHRVYGGRGLSEPKAGDLGSADVVVKKKDCGSSKGRTHLQAKAEPLKRGVRLTAPQLHVPNPLLPRVPVQSGVVLEAKSNFIGGRRVNVAPPNCPAGFAAGVLSRLSGVRVNDLSKPQ